MAEEKMMRLSQVARILNVGISTIVDHLSANGTKVESNPNTKINSKNIEFLAQDFNSGELRNFLAAAPKPVEVHVPEPIFVPEPPKPVEAPVSNDAPETIKAAPSEKPAETSENVDMGLSAPKLPGFTVVGKINLDAKGNVVEPPKPEVVPEPEVVAPEPQPKIEPKTVEPAPVPEAIVEKAIEPPVQAAPVEKPVIEKEQPKPVEPPKPVQPEPVKEVPKPVVPQPKAEDQVIEAKGEQLRGLRVVGKIELPVEKAKKKDDSDGNDSNDRSKKRKRKRIRDTKVDTKTPATPAAAGPKTDANKGGFNKPANKDASKPDNAGQNNANKSSSGSNQNFKKRDRREQVSDKEVASNIKATMARMGQNTGPKGRGRNKRRDRNDQNQENLNDDGESKILRVTEFVSANDLATLMEVSVQEVISVCMSMGLFVSINQRLDAEAITFIADEFGFEVAFISAEEDVSNEIQEEEDLPEDLTERAPIVTIMGHVDHGKTSLLDYIRKANVASGEAGGITQHIGAYSVKTKTGKLVTFLDTPGHEAFTAMRARGAKVTDVVIIVIAADDSVMPQTREAINHAQVAGVPIVFAFSKVDKPGANTEKVREELAQMNLLVEEWGGKYQTQEISSKSGLGIDELLEKVLLEAELLELKANPKRRATGTVIEASLDKGRGYVTTLLVENGTMKVGDFILAGAHYGRVRAMTDHRGNRLKSAGPSMPVQLLGLNGAPQAGDKFNVMENERDAREIATKREQIQREQTMRTRKHITLEEIGRRKAIGTFRELNLIVKGDVDGSVEALSDSLLQLSTGEVQINIIHKAVGQISESDVNLAIASDAIIVGFQVRPSSNAKKMAEQEQIEIRHYSVIYNAIEEIKDAMTGMLAPTVEEVITGNIEIREIFKISRIGTIAGSYVTDGFVKRNNKIRVVRDGIVIHTGEIDSLKRFKDDVNEVKSGYEFGLSVKGFNDLEIGDTIESFEFKEVKRTL